MRPRLRLLEDSLISRIVDEARCLLTELGIEIHSARAAELLQAFGARVDAAGRVLLTDTMIDAALKTVPHGFPLYDISGNLTHELADDRVYFTPGSAAINILDGRTGEMRRPDTADYVRYVKLTEGLANIASQATAFIPADVPEKISDSYRLYLSLLYGAKPVVTGAFTIDAFEVMKDLQGIVRGSEQALREKPLAIVSCCPTAPLKWSDVTCENLLDCGRWSIPAELISMPLSGFVAPVTLVGSLVQQTAENLSGVVIHQLAGPGCPILWGGSPAIFDMRHETTPMGAVETMMLDCAASEIGKWLKMPTQGYIALSDAKLLDAQAGLETGIGATLAALSGINSVSGTGMLDFGSCQSLEKLVLDNEICGMALRLVRGIQPREDFPAIPIFRELLAEKHLLIADHTRRHLREEIVFPGSVIDRANRARWAKDGGTTLGQRAAREVARIVARYAPPPLADETRAELTRRVSSEARRFGMDALPPTS